MKQYFKNYHKSQSAKVHINEQLSLTNQEIAYLKAILVQLEFVNQQELQEIITELKTEGYLKDYHQKTKKIIPSIKNITKYQLGDALILVGKNNLQNNYLTHTYAKKSDYWFHVKDAPSSHVIVQAKELTEDIIRFASNLCALNSKYDKSSSVPVDYTKISYLKKVPNTPGSFVTYTNQKTIYIDPSELYLQNILIKYQKGTN